MLLNRYPIISDQVDKNELALLLTELESLLLAEQTGNVVEFGCYIGTTSIFIRRLLDAYHSIAEFHVYDSFMGLPEKTDHDHSPTGLQFQAGQLSARKKDFVRHFKKSGLRLPYIHKGWFADMTDKDVPDNIMFAYLDGDYYESIRDSFRLITPKLLSGAIILVDDYANLALPGAARATNEWCKQYSKGLSIHHDSARIRV